LVELVRTSVVPERGAQGILEELDRQIPPLLRRHSIQQVAVGFGGPVDSQRGVVLKSHQIAGWDQFPLAAWLRERTGLAVHLGNDCDYAALGEALLGAGRPYRSVFYVTVGTGVGGGYVVAGKLHGGGRPAVAEIGHLRPGIHDDRPELTVESLASGWGIAAAARASIEGDVSRPLDVLRHVQRGTSKIDRRWQLEREEATAAEYRRDLSERCGNQLDQLTARHVAHAARDGNPLALAVLDHAAQVLGWAVGQTITLLAPECVVLGGGVLLTDDDLFFTPVARYVRKYVFPPLAEAYVLLHPALGEEMVLFGALLGCRSADQSG
jgi:glucokinase